MNFLGMQQAVADTLGLSLNITAQATQIQRYINQACRIVYQSFDWPFLKAPNPYTLQTVTDYTTGTVTTTAGSTSVTFSGNISNSVAGYYLQTSSSKDWYRVTAHTAGTATATLEAPAIYTGSSVTFTLRQFFYSLNATPAIDRIYSVKQPITPFQLMEMSETLFNEVKPDPNTTGTPKLFILAGQDASGHWQMGFWPIPNQVQNISIEYLQEPVDLSANTDTGVIPDKWRSTVIVEGAVTFGYQSLDDSRFPNALAVFNAGIDAMKMEYGPSTSKTRIMRSVDQALNLKPIPFPENYPLVR